MEDWRAPWSTEAWPDEFARERENPPEFLNLDFFWYSRCIVVGDRRQATCGPPNRSALSRNGKEGDPGIFPRAHGIRAEGRALKAE
jgi:hypothetical protein